MRNGFWMALAGLALATAVEAQEPVEGPYPLTFDRAEMKTRDGVTLWADIYRPQAKGPFPVLLLRTPYNKQIYIAEATRAATRGYLCVVQDCRGRYMSEGEWEPFRTEGADGYDAVEWAAALPGSDGRVILAGISYVGATALLGAIETPPHLAAVYAGITASDYHDNWAYQGGAMCLQFARGWSSGMQLHALQRLLGASPLNKSFPLDKPPAELGMVDYARAGREASFYADWIAHPADDAYWKQVSIAANYAKITVPVLHMGAWYDLFMPGAVRNYTGIRDQGGSEVARRGQRLVLIPGGHAGFGRKVGEVDFGEKAAFDFWGYALDWMDWQVKGLANGWAQAKPVRLFVMGRNEWRDEADWPLARAVPTRYYLRSGGRANSMAGDGTLETAPPADEPADRFLNDPGNPVPTLGGVVSGMVADLSGPRDQRTVEGRDDVLVYTTAPFARDTEVTGPVALELFVSSTAPDTDFTGKLVDVYPDGRAMELSAGILRMRYRDTPDRAEMMNPGEVYKIRLELRPTANVFLAGHRLRLEVAGSNYPQYDRNPNTGAEPGTARIYVPATNTVRHDREHPSALILPVVP
ncbi:MAG: CocE/NonD family hydrolase [Opitutaceae bacterium]|nr:CocE/NonD family hydrolase [Cephaloticoccus sp.]MCP5529319.1 CocE/NonD family hydrolase [Opitutaceae bacterium]